MLSLDLVPPLCDGGVRLSRLPLALESDVFRIILALGVPDAGATALICAMAVSDYRGCGCSEDRAGDGR